MNCDALLNLAMEIGCQLMRSGAEIYRVEESVYRLLQAYGGEDAQVFAIPSCLIVSLRASDGHPVTRMRRIPPHGTDIELLERCNELCRTLCRTVPPLEQAQELTARGWELLPVMSNTAARCDTRFGRAGSWRQRLEALTGHPVLDSLQAVEPLGPKNMAEALVIAPCTGSTLARLAAGLSDTPVTLAAKSLLRVGCPVVLAVSTNDGLGASGENIARLFQRKHYYFVPYGQDDPAAKPQSLKADFARLPAALEAALHGEQLQPVLLGQRERAMAFQPGQNVVY